MSEAQKGRDVAAANTGAKGGCGGTCERATRIVIGGAVGLHDRTIFRRVSREHVCRERSAKG